MECTGKTNTNSTFCNPSIETKWAVGTINVLLTILGTFCNIALILIFKQKDLKSTFNSLMILQATFDLSYIWIFGLNALIYAMELEQIITSTLFMVGWAWNCCAFTKMAISMERFLVLCKNRKIHKFSFKLKTSVIMISALVLMLPYYNWCRGNQLYFVITRIWQFLIQAAIPVIFVLFLSFAVYKKLKLLRESEEFEQADEALKKSVGRARLTLVINTIFVTCTCLYWLRLPVDVRYKIVFHKHFVWILLKLAFQIAKWNPTFNVLKSGFWRTLMTSVGGMISLIYCSSNFLVLKYLLWKEKRSLQTSNRPNSTFYVSLI